MNTEDPPEIGTYQMDQLVVNPANTNGRRYLMVEISLELNVEHIPLMETTNPRVRQELIETFSRRTVSQLTTPKERDLLRKEVVEIINSSIGETSGTELVFHKVCTSMIINIYFENDGFPVTQKEKGKS